MWARDGRQWSYGVAYLATPSPIRLRTEKHIPAFRAAAARPMPWVYSRRASAHAET